MSTWKFQFQFKKIRQALHNISVAKRVSWVSHLSTHNCLNQERNMAFIYWRHPPFSIFPMKGLHTFRPWHRSILYCNLSDLQHLKFSTNALVTLKTDSSIARFSFDTPDSRHKEDQTRVKKSPKRTKMSRKAKLKELRFYRLKAKKKMKSPNPEVRIRYKLGKAKRKEEWLIEKLRKYEMPRAPDPVSDPEILTKEERFYLRRTGEKKKNYVVLGRRGVFGGVVLNMHLHWKKHETVKVVCKPCRPGQVHEYAEELARLSKGIVIDVKPNNIILFYRGKNYAQPDVMSPPGTLSKKKALEKYKFQQSLEHTSQYIEQLEEELEEYHKHVASYKDAEKNSRQCSGSNN